VTFSERMRNWVEQGVSASKHLAEKAGAAAQDAGEKGVLKIEIMQLESQAQKLVARLGSEAYALLVEQRKATISSEDPSIRGILAEVASIRAAIEKKEAELHQSI